MRKVVSDVLGQDSRIEVVGTAKNGYEGKLLVEKLRPTVVTMDVEMPVMDGLQAVREIMMETPVPILMLSTLTQAGAKETFAALENGAVDFVTKPGSMLKVSTPEFQSELIEKVVAASTARVYRLRPLLSRNTGVFRAAVAQPSPALSSPTGVPSTTLGAPSATRTGTQSTALRLKKLVAIGISTGGPRALQEVITKLPKTLSAGVVIVQHMPATFTKTLADRLDSLSPIRVVEAEDGDIVQAGTVYIAPGDRHLKITRQSMQYVIKLDDTDRVNGHRPSADVMFDSLAELQTDRILGIVMTGMGGDGGAGLKKLRDNGCQTFAQDEASCVVYGMPKVAVQLGGVDRIVSLSEMADEIVKSVEGESWT